MIRYTAEIITHRSRLERGVTPEWCAFDNHKNLWVGTTKSTPLGTKIKSIFPTKEECETFIKATYK